METSQLLKAKKLNITPFRLEVLDIFSKYKTAIPLSTVEQELGDYNRITLYRTIKTFVEKGVIHEIALSGAENNFAICADSCGTEHHEHKHIHFKCENCKAVLCVEIENFPNIKLPGFTIQELEIQASGICKSCQ